MAEAILQLPGLHRTSSLLITLRDEHIWAPRDEQTACPVQLGELWNGLNDYTGWMA